MMLKNFSVANFRSIKNPISLSCLKEKEKEMENRLIPVQNQFILPELMILGPNGSGKSNLLEAISVSKTILQTSSMRTNESPIPGIQPYAFDLETQSAPVEFEYEITIEKEAYIYGFAATEKRIVQEYLYRFRTNRPSLIFSRQEEEYEFTKKNKAHYSKYLKRNSKNKLFLSTAAVWEDPLCQKVYHAIVYTMDSFKDLGEIEKQMVKDLQDPLKKEQFLKDLYQADMDFHDLPLFLANEDQAFEKNSTSSQVLKLPFSLESEGTKRFMVLMYRIRKALNQGQTLIVDNLEYGLHPLLVKQIMDRFMDPEENIHQAQLIFTTHSPWMMEMGKLRSDQIVLVDKTRDDLITEVFKISEFESIKEGNDLISYFQGRYGAIPHLIDA